MKLLRRARRRLVALFLLMMMVQSAAAGDIPVTDPGDNNEANNLRLGVAAALSGDRLVFNNAVTNMPIQLNSTLDIGLPLLEIKNSVGFVSIQNFFVNVSGALTLNAFAAGDTLEFGSPIIGTGSLIKTGDGILSLTANSPTFAGLITIQQGTVSITDNVTQGDIINNGKLVYEQGAAITYGGNISGTGSLTKNGDRPLTLTGINTYTGGTFINDGSVTGDTLSLQGNIANNTGNVGGLVFNQGFDDTFRGSISGTGGVTKDGGGTLILASANTYAGGTLINAGNLQGDTTSLQGDFIDNSTLTFAQDFNGTFAGDITGTGSVVKSGSGTVTFAGDYTYTGTTNILAGGLQVDGSIAGDVMVGGAGSLGGNGSFQNLIVRGKLAPGNSIGVVNVAGTLAFATGSTYEVEVDNLGNSDLVVVGGTTTIQNGTTLNLLGSGVSPRVGSLFTILTSAGGITGTFTNVTDNIPIRDAIVSYGTNAITLELVRSTAPYVNAAGTRNQRAVVAGLLSTIPRAVGDYGDVLDIIGVQNGPVIRDALEQISGEIHADLPSVVLQDFVTVNHTIGRRLRSISPRWVEDTTRRFDPTAPAAPAPAPAPRAAAGGPTAAVAAAATASVAAPYTGLTGIGNDSVKDPWSAWFEGYGYRTQAEDDGNARNLAFDGHGGLFGIDRTFGLRTMGGVFGALGRTDLNLRGRLDSADVESTRVGAYLRHEWDSFHMTGILSYADNDFDVSRRLIFGGVDRVSTSKYGGHGLSGYLEVGTNLRHGGWSVEPIASLQLASIKSGGFGEEGANSLSLYGNAIDASSALVSLGGRATYPTENSKGYRTIPEVRARWMHELRSSDDRSFTAALVGAPVNPFTIVGTDLGRDYAVIGAGISVQTSDQGSIFVSYDAQLSKKSDTHTGETGFRLKF